MARPKDPNLERAWRQRLQRQSPAACRSPRSVHVKAFPSASFHAWKRRLAARSLPTPAEPPLFVPLRLDSAPPQAGPALVHGVEIELPHQVRLRFDSPPEPEWLGRVVAALAGLPRRRPRHDHAPLRRPHLPLHPAHRHAQELRRPHRAGPGVLRPGPLDRPSLPLPQPPQGSASRSSTSIATAWPSGTSDSRPEPSRCPRRSPNRRRRTPAGATGHDPLRDRPEEVHANASDSGTPAEGQKSG